MDVDTVNAVSRISLANPEEFARPALVENCDFCVKMREHSFDNLDSRLPAMQAITGALELA
jgi:hypothetical protein